MDLAKTKSLFFKVLIGCLIAAAGVAVVTVLFGKFTDVTTKALFTILLVAAHALVSIAFINNNQKQDTFDSLAFFTNATFAIIILSFITSVGGTWDLVSGALVAKLYALYFVLLFAVLHAEVLAKTLGKQANIDKIVRFNFVFMAVVVVMLLPVIFASDASLLGAFYYRLLAACGIIDATLTLIAVILHNLYVQKHPKIADPVFSVQQLPNGQTVQVAVQQPKRHMNVFVRILIAFIAVQAIGSIVVGIIGSINN
ncbi:MAG TPA: hypothetical protein VLH84_04055 [Patescibacteria group bacterium]|nr:hypothetical protein [Patescibacteria group bacterium]